MSERFLELLHRLPIRIEPASLIYLFGEVITLAREQDLSTYDAVYLDLAMRSGLPSVTLDAGPGFRSCFPHCNSRGGEADRAYPDACFASQSNEHTDDLHPGNFSAAMAGGPDKFSRQSYYRSVHRLCMGRIGGTERRLLSG